MLLHRSKKNEKYFGHLFTPYTPFKFTKPAIHTIYQFVLFSTQLKSKLMRNFCRYFDENQL